MTYTSTVCKIVLSLSIFVFSGITFAQDTSSKKEEPQKSSEQGITFKVPDKFMKAPLSGFKGLMLLNADAPAVIVISYPNENESIDDLTKRIVKLAPTLFADPAQKERDWISKPIEVHPGDRPNSGVLYASKSGEDALQLALFQREWKGLTIIYGCFAMRNGNTKEKELRKYWMDESGGGVKPFEAFWQSFPAKN